MKRLCAVLVMLVVWLVLFFSAIAVAVGPVQADVLRCQIATKFYCEADAGCAPIPAKVWNEIDLSLSEYSRCDSSGCDTFPVNITAPGATLVIEAPGSGLVAKILADHSFMEVATLMTTAYVSFGHCSE